MKAIAGEIKVRYPADKKTADDEIAKRALSMLLWDAEVPDRVKVLVQDGWITLTGSVDWYYQKRAAEDAVRKLSGVHGVTCDQQYSDFAAGQTRERTKKMEDALKRHAEVEAHAIKVTVRDDSSVLLEGKVDNWEERYAVEQAAWAAAGVRSVDDRLLIS